MDSPLRRTLCFHKYQALGNDFVLIDGRIALVADPPLLSRLLCRRKYGVGADGLLLVLPHTECAARMEFYNPDGSRAGMCGNGLRCVARFLHESGWERRDRFFIMTDPGPRHVTVSSTTVEASLGVPSLSAASLPMASPHSDLTGVDLGIPGLPPAVCVSVGNPHCVLFVSDINAIPLSELGPRIENHSLFPHRINVEFVQVRPPDQLICRVWERGAGETASCGTGAAAACIAATVRGLLSGSARVTLPGGQLTVSWERGGEVTIAGPAEPVFQGTVLLPATVPVR